jgi:hypothetical protein
MPTLLAFLAALLLCLPAVSHADARGELDSIAAGHADAVVDNSRAEGSSSVVFERLGGPREPLNPPEEVGHRVVTEEPAAPPKANPLTDKTNLTVGVFGALAGLAIGFAFGPWGMVIGALVGFVLGFGASWAVRKFLLKK